MRNGLHVIRPVSAYPPNSCGHNVMVHPALLFGPKAKPALLTAVRAVNKLVAVEVPSAAVARSVWQVGNMLVVLEQPSLAQRELGLQFIADFSRFRDFVFLKDDPYVLFPVQRRLPQRMLLEFGRCH